MLFFILITGVLCVLGGFVGVLYGVVYHAVSGFDLRQTLTGIDHQMERTQLNQKIADKNLREIDLLVRDSRRKIRSLENLTKQVAEIKESLSLITHQLKNVQEALKNENENEQD